MASAYTLCRGNVAGVASIGKGRLLVSVQGDGVSCYDTADRKSVASWALGSGTGHEFGSATVYDYATNLCFAPLRARGGGGAAGAKAGGDSVLAWCPDDTGGTITQLGRPLHLPAVHRLFPLSHTPETEEEEAAAAAAEESGIVDGSGAAKAGAVAVLASGGAALCSGAEVVAEAEAAAGRQTLAAALQGSRLVVIASEPRGAAFATVYAVEDGGLEQQACLQLEPPAAGARAVTASSTPERTAVLWSDGTVAVYGVPGDKQPLLPLPTGDSRQAIAQRRLAGFRLPAAGKQKGGASGAGAGKKRGAAAADPEAAAGSPSMAAVSDKQLALAGWATNSEGLPVLRLVVLETAAACVQLSQDFAAADVGLAAFDTAKPVQAEFLGGGRLALCIGSAVLVASLDGLPKPTLANLLGALAIDKALLAMRASGSGSDNVLSAPAAAQQLLGSTVAVNPAALAAARVLHPDEIAALTEPFGGAARPIDCRMELEEPMELGQWLVEAKEVHWKVKDDAADAAIAAEERRVWQAVQQPAAEARSSEAAMQQLLEPLFGLRRSSGLELSPRLIANLLMLAAERGYWGTVEAIVAVQAPWLLGDVPGLAAAAADQGRIELAAELLQSTADVPAAELAALLRVLLSPPSSDAAAAGRQARHNAAEAAAAAAEEAAQQAAAGVPQAQQQEQQQEQQQQEAPATAGKPGRRRRGRKRGGSDAGAASAAAAGAEGGEDSDSDVEDLTALVGIFEPGAERSRGGAPAGASGPADLAQTATERPGEREAAVAACCRAAVAGLSPADTCLHAVVALPHRHAVLLGALCSLSGTQAVQLMHYLVATLRNVTAMVGSAAAGWVPPLQLPRGTALPSLDQLVSWTGALIDTCLIKLSLEPEARPLAAQLSEMVAAQLAEMRPLLKLPGMIEHVLQLAARPKAAGATADYSVQWLDLRVLPPELRERELRQREADAISGGLVLPKAQQAAALRAQQQAQQAQQQQQPEQE